MATSVLVIDDEQGIRDLLLDILEEEGYEVLLAKNGQEGLRTFFEHQPDLVVLDILMPRMDGWQLLERIRELADTPVVILTALDREPQTVRGLRSGADDYVVKPIRRMEFLARVEAALRKRRSQAEESEEIYSDSALHVDFRRHHVQLEGEEVDLSAQEFRVLAALVRNKSVVLSTDQLLDMCWREGIGAPENVRVYIGYLRRKLGDDPRNPSMIETVREFGYRYRPPAE